MSIDLVAEKGFNADEIRIYGYSHSFGFIPFKKIPSKDAALRNHQIAALAARVFLEENMHYSGTLRVLTTLDIFQVIDGGDDWYEKNPGLYVYDRSAGLATLVNDSTARGIPVSREKIRGSGEL